MWLKGHFMHLHFEIFLFSLTPSWFMMLDSRPTETEIPGPKGGELQLPVCKGSDCERICPGVQWHRLWEIYCCGMQLVKTSFGYWRCVVSWLHCGCTVCHVLNPREYCGENILIELLVHGCYTNAPLPTAMI